MKDYIQSDRKQVFGAEELDEFYLLKIKNILEQQIRTLSRPRKDNSVTMPLTQWVN